MSLLNGLSELGKVVSQTAQASLLESQRADFDRQKIELADQLAGAREEKGRAFQTSERIGKQQFEGAENEKTRATTLEGHRISAAASMASSGAHLQGVRETIAASIQGAAKVQIGDGGEAFTVNPVTKEVAPLKGPDGQQLKFRDPDVAKAQLELIKTKTTQLTDITRTYVPQIQALESSLRALKTGPMAITEESKRQAADTETRLKALQERFESEKAPLIRDLNAYGDALIVKGKLQTPGQGTGQLPPLSSFNPGGTGTINTAPDGRY